jgi:hypothetical protein
LQALSALALASGSRPALPDQPAADTRDFCGGAPSDALFIPGASSLFGRLGQGIAKVAA